MHNSDKLDTNSPEACRTTAGNGFKYNTFSTLAEEPRNRRSKVVKALIDTEAGDSTSKAPAQVLASSKLSVWREVARRLWLLAWPLCGMEILTFTKELIITSFVGHLGPLELSALVLAQTLYNVTGQAPMMGVVAAMETFCGQAYGARKYALVGVILQRALVIVMLMCLCAIGIWAHAQELLLWMGQDPEIARAAGKLTFMLSPSLLMDAADQSFRRYLAAQSVVQPPMVVTMIATLLTPLFLWLYIIKLGFGFEGAAAAWNSVQFVSLALLVLYTLHHNRLQEPGRRTWAGLSREAFHDWGGYIRMAVPSTVMICLDWWTFEIIVLLSGLLPNPEVTMSMMGITFNVHALCFMAAHGLSGAASTRVGNELGAGRPKLAWITTQVAVLMGTLAMSCCALALLLGRRHLGVLFSDDAHVVFLTSQAVVPLAASLVGEGANTVLAGVLRGCGRQQIGATINLVVYWGVGLPVSAALAFWMKLGSLGLWTGLACTASAQALILSLCVFRFDWDAEAQRAQALVACGELLLEGDEGGELLVVE